MGYATAVTFAALVLDCIASMPWLNADEVQKAQAVVLRVVDSMQPAARSLGVYTLPEEEHFAAYLREVVRRGAYPAMDPAFITSLRTRWTDASMKRMFRARNLLDTKEGDEMAKELLEVEKAEQRADIAKYGLKECALPSCGKREVSVGQHKRCSACRSMWCCSAEHGALHWKEHKPICRATTAAQ